MENEHEITAAAEAEAEELEKDLQEADDTDWKAETFKYRGIAKRYKTDIGKLKQAQTEAEAKAKAVVPEKAPEEKTNFDFGEKTFLTASGIPKEDWDTVFQEVKATGKDLETVLGFKYVQETLKSSKEERASKNAIPEGGKRTGSTGHDVDYYLAKNELPPPEQKQLRRDYINARMKAEASAQKTL